MGIIFYEASCPLLGRLTNSSVCPTLPISSQQSFASCELEEKKKHRKYHFEIWSEHHGCLQTLYMTKRTQKNNQHIIGCDFFNYGDIKVDQP